MPAALEDGEWSAARPGRTLPPGEKPVPILQEAGWTPGAVAEYLVPTVFRTRIVQHVVSHYTN